MTYSHLDIAPANAAVGAFVNHLDLSETLTDAVTAELLRAHADYGVLFFRDQHLSSEQHIDLAERLVQINVNRFFTPVAGYPMIAEVLADIRGSDTNEVTPLEALNRLAAWRRQLRGEE